MIFFVVFDEVHRALRVLYNSRSVYCLITMRAVVQGGSLLHLSALSYILVPAFSDVLLLVWLLHFLYSFGPGYLGILYMWFCFSIYSGIIDLIHSFLLPGVDHMLVHEVLKAHLYILITFLCMLLRF